MKLIGYACKHPDPPLREAFLALSDLTVLLGPNDAGKSSLLRAVDRDLSGGHFDEADEEEVKLTGGVFYAEVSDNELWAIASTAARTRTEHGGELGRSSRGRRAPWDDGLWRPPKYDGLHPAEPEDWISHLRGEAEGRDAVLDALRDSRVVAIECAGINKQNQRVWNTYWCLQPMASLDESVRVALEASDVPFLARKRKEGPSWYSVGLYAAVHGNAAHLHVDGAPVPVVALGPHVDLPMPAGLAAPADFATIREAVRDGITRLVDTAAHTGDVTLDGDPLPNRAASRTGSSSRLGRTRRAGRPARPARGDRGSTLPVGHDRSAASRLRVGHVSGADRAERLGRLVLRRAVRCSPAPPGHRVADHRLPGRAVRGRSPAMASCREQVGVVVA